VDDATPASPSERSGLSRTLGPVMLWALGVGYVISGMYFGWNLGLPRGGPYGLLAATIVVTILYVAFVLSYAELACAMPRAGGAFVYAHRAFGPTIGFVAGVAQCVEFVFAPPAIAAAIGAYVHLFAPSLPPIAIALAAYAVFTALNAWGVKQSAIFELVITLLAVGELLLFAGIAAPRFTWAAFSRDPLPNGWWGAFGAIPYAIWFYLAIEGVANVAEEARDPKRDIPRGFLAAMATLVVLAALTFFGAVGVDGWAAVVYPPGSDSPSDSPLPLALGKIVGGEHPLYHLLIGIGLCGLVASFHGILLIAGRATMELGRVGYAPAVLGRTHPTRKTPIAALVFNFALGAVALFTGRTAEIITISVFGALTLYAIAMASLFALRRREPDLPRPYRAPLHPIVPGVALVLAVVCLVALAVDAPLLGAVFLALVFGALGLWRLLVPAEVRRRALEHATPPPPHGSP
jgi:ethanolamine permease